MDPHSGPVGAGASHAASAPPGDGCGDAVALPPADAVSRWAESLHRTLTANLPDTSMFLLDRDLRVVLAEGQGVRSLPWIDENMFRGRMVADLQGELPADVLAVSLECYRAALAGERREFEFSSNALTFSVTAVPIRGTSGTVEAALAVVCDVTRSKLAEQQLAQRARQQECVARLGQSALRERDLRNVLDAVVAGVAETLDVELCSVLALRQGEDMMDVVASVGFRAGALRDAQIRRRPNSQAGYALGTPEPIVVDDLATESRFVASALLLDHGVVSGMSVVVDGRDEPFGVLSAHSRRSRHFGADDVHFLRAVAHLLSAAIERRTDEETSRQAALHDPLTGLPNRTLALDRLDHALDRRRRDGTNVAALVIDLDRFRVINDSLGHRAGDELLLALAPRLRAVLRPHDTLARLGGDEFLIVCEAPRGVRQVITVADRVAAEIGRPFMLDSGEHFVNASIGIALAAGADDTPESMLRDADAAMYRAKNRGRGRYELFDDATRAVVLARLRTEAELRRAVENGELRVHYQPIIHVAGGHPVAAEALVRWEHPLRGMIAPLDFIPLAEETGLIIDIGRWMLEQACRQGARWQRRFGRPLKMFVNVSGRQIADPLFPSVVAAIVAGSGLLPATLGLEVTESVLIEEAEGPMTVLSELVAQGLRLVLDDFGTGYSSLSYLKQFPLAGLKIDRAFTKGLGRIPADTAIVKAVIDMSQALGLTVVAEGVETEEQFEQLRRLGCARVQGYLFSRPAPAAEIDAFLLERLGLAAARTHAAGA